MQEYRGPATMNGYTTDVGAEQRDAAARGNAEGAGRRKGLAGLGGAAATIGALLVAFQPMFGSIDGAVNIDAGVNAGVVPSIAVFIAAAEPIGLKTEPVGRLAVAWFNWLVP